ncbi:MAG: hypothetical protein MR828_10440, partial [Clostridiales bacterium]|nr:hypothetical protein [Clostridiales bacterium]
EFAMRWPHSSHLFVMVVPIPERKSIIVPNTPPIVSLFKCFLKLMTLPIGGAKGCDCISPPNYNLSIYQMNPMGEKMTKQVIDMFLATAFAPRKV